MSTAIEFNHVGKQYRLGLVSTRTLSHDLNRWWQTSVLGKEDPYLKIGEVNDRATTGSSDYVWALRDIDFKVEQGDVVGIIGKNGAGKSTLLKLLSKVTGPTTGTIRARGRIGALLEVGTGFHPEMTGRENIYMNGAIMGMTKNDIARKLDEIVAFSGCERYIDTPVKRYSSGMTVRLGFAVAAHLDPEILVVDEVLAVGDAEFQKKAIGKMKDVSRGEGRTVLFVSHNMASIKALCKNGILLENGSIKDVGEINQVVNLYLQQAYQGGLCNIWEKSLLEEKDVQLIRATISTNNGVPCSSFTCDESFVLRLVFSVRNKVPGLYGYLRIIRATDGTDVWISDSNDTVYNKLEGLPIGESSVRLVFPKRSLAPGSYIVALNLSSCFSSKSFMVDSNEQLCRFELNDYGTERGNQRMGFFSTVIDWEIGK